MILFSFNLKNLTALDSSSMLIDGMGNAERICHDYYIDYSAQFFFSVFKMQKQNTLQWRTKLNKLVVNIALFELFKVVQIILSHYVSPQMNAAQDLICITSCYIYSELLMTLFSD